MQWEVRLSKHAAKRVGKMPVREQDLLLRLMEDLKNDGPVQSRWKNYSKLSKDEYHCHLSYKWVACWRVTADGVAEIEIYYAGSREDAPYG